MIPNRFPTDCPPDCLFFCRSLSVQLSVRLCLSVGMYTAEPAYSYNVYSRFSAIVELNLYPFAFISLLFYPCYSRLLFQQTIFFLLESTKGGLCCIQRTHFYATKIPGPLIRALGFFGLHFLWTIFPTNKKKTE